MKFLIFIDDLSFSKQDDTYASLKAVLEGGVAARPANTLIYATSNRRHLVRETFSDREGDEVHRGDSIQESLSLADRFGLAVNFSQPTKHISWRSCASWRHSAGCRITGPKWKKGRKSGPLPAADGHLAAPGSMWTPLPSNCSWKPPSDSIVKLKYM